MDGEIIMLNKKQSNHDTLSEIHQDLIEGIKNLRFIIKKVENEDSIDAFKSSYCKDCDKPCGRSNAEIYNCMMKKLDHAKKIQEQYEEMQYTKDYLEKDLDQLHKKLNECNKKMNAILK